MWAEYTPRSSRSEEMNMKTTRGLSIGMVALVIAVLPAAAQTRRAAQQSTDPAIHWYSMLKVPAASEFPLSDKLKSQAQWLDVVKTNGCYTCHQLGNKATRTIPKELGTFDSSTDAWQRRIQSGQAMIQMTTNL